MSVSDYEPPVRCPICDGRIENWDDTERVGEDDESAHTRCAQAERDEAAAAQGERRVEARLERGGFLDVETADATSELLERHLRAAWMVEELRARR